MRKPKIWLIIAASLIFVGIIFVGVSAVSDWSFGNVFNTNFETNSYEINEAYNNISVLTDTADIEFKVSQNNKTEIVCREHPNVKHSVLVENGDLVIKLNDTRKWYEHIIINFKTPKITVYLPKGELGALEIKGGTGDVEIPSDFTFKSVNVAASTGDVRVEASALEDVKITASTGDIWAQSITAQSLELSVSTGQIETYNISCGDFSVAVSTGGAEIENVNCMNFDSSGSTGDISLEKLVATEKLSVLRSTGDIEFEDCDAAEIYMRTDTGDVEGSFKTDKIIFATSHTGNVSVPKTVVGGKCEVETDTGDIEIVIKN